jgi:hypothetical protein
MNGGNTGAPFGHHEHRDTLDGAPHPHLHFTPESGLNTLRIKGGTLAKPNVRVATFPGGFFDDWVDALTHVRCRCRCDGTAEMNQGGQPDVLGDTSPSCRFWPRIIFGNAGENHWRTVGKLGDQRKIPAHGLDRFSERGQQEIAPLFKA